MIEVKFYQRAQIEDGLIKFAVCAARYDNRWVFCRHKRRSTWEFPGGHREKGETIEAAARRELWEETGALKADISLVAVYEVITDGIYSYGALFFAEISALGPLPEEMEIGELLFSEKIPEQLTYPEILPCLYRQTREWLNLRNSPVNDHPVVSKELL